MTRFTRTVVLSAGIALLTAAIPVAALPAVAATPVVACHWIQGEYLDTYTCDEPGKGAATHRIVECWKYPPAPRARVEQRAPGGWERNPGITVSTAGTKGCSGPYPYRTVVRVPGDQLIEGSPIRLRLTMPAHSVVLPNGRPYRVQKTTVEYSACLMSTRSATRCPRR
jgi:hypothetical protein